MVIVSNEARILVVGYDVYEQCDGSGRSGTKYRSSKCYRVLHFVRHYAVSSTNYLMSQKNNSQLFLGQFVLKERRN